MSSGQSTGSIVGMVVGGILGAVFTPFVGPGALYAGFSLGASSPPVPAAPPRHGTPPGMSALLSPLLGLPFQFGGRDPNSGLDCGGLVLYLLRHGLGVELRTCGPYGVLWHPLVPIWTQPGNDASWCEHLHPWDVVVWYDPAGEAALRGEGETWHTLYHVGMAINSQVLVSATVDLGVALFSAARIAECYGEHVAMVLRAPGVSPWQAVRSL